MLSQLTKTIKIALKSTEEERALLRARSAVQRFPVVEWRQRTEDFHRRSITTSRALAGEMAFRTSDCDASGGPVAANLDHDDWDPVHQAEPSQPDWDAQSIRTVNSPNHLSPGGPTLRRPASSASLASTLAPGQYDPNRASSDTDYFSQPHGSSSENGASPFADTPTPGSAGYGDFLSRANRQIARDQRHVPDPFLDDTPVAPNRPFGAHSRVSSVESITSIMDEKGASSPLNKAIASV